MYAVYREMGIKLALSYSASGCNMSCGVFTKSRGQDSRPVRNTRSRAYSLETECWGSVLVLAFAWSDKDQK